MRIVFLGTGGFGVPVLRALAGAKLAPALVISQPDRPAGRRQVPTAPPLAAAARELGLPLEQPERINRPDARERVRALEPDVLVVVAYGQILKRPVLDLPRLGCVNVHASLLPRHRGASPVQAAILAGDAETGVTIMLMDEGLDTGPILLQEATAVGPHETAGELEGRLAELGSRLIVPGLRDLAEGRARPRPQDDARATRCGLITKDDAALDWREPAALLARRIRAYQPWPGAFTLIPCRGDLLRLSIEASEPEPGVRAAPGEIVEAEGDRLVVATGQDGLRILRAKPAGRRSLAAAELLRGYPVEPGTIARSAS